MATITAMPRYAHAPRPSISSLRSGSVGPGPSSTPRDVKRPRHRPTASTSSINKLKAAAAASGTPPSKRTSISMSPSQHPIPEDGTAPVHPFANTTSLLTVIRDEPTINIEEEARFYDEFESDDDKPSSSRRSFASDRRSSILSHDIWLEHHEDEDTDLFARDVKINGWTSVGDKRGGAYIVYDCAITTKEGLVIHVLKRYSAFFELQLHLLRTLPRDVRHFLPTLPPKSPLAKFRSAFLERRRKALQLWLTQVCLHPDIGGTKAVKEWIVENN